MAISKWNQRLDTFKKNAHPETVLMVDGQAELIRIAAAWRNTEVARARRLTKFSGQTESEVWAWLWENALYDRAALLARIPNANARTAKNLDALMANRVLYPDGTLNMFVERYLRERVVRLFSPSVRRRTKDAAVCTTNA